MSIILFQFATCACTMYSTCNIDSVLSIIIRLSSELRFSNGLINIYTKFNMYFVFIMLHNWVFFHVSLYSLFNSVKKERNKKLSCHVNGDKNICRSFLS